MPALPLHEAGKYVAAAYVVFFGLVLVYVAIMAARLSRLERDLGELLALAERRRAAEGSGAAGSGPGGSGASDSGPDDEEPVGGVAASAAAPGAVARAGAAE